MCHSTIMDTNLVITKLDDIPNCRSFCQCCLQMDMTMYRLDDPKSGSSRMFEVFMGLFFYIQNGSNRILCDECCYRIIFLYEFWTVALLSKQIILNNQPLQFRKADVHLKRKNASNPIFRSYVQRLFVLKQKTDAHRQYFMRQLENYAGEDHYSLTPDLSLLHPYQYTAQAPYTLQSNPTTATSSNAVPQSFIQNVVDPYQRIAMNNNNNNTNPRDSYAQNNTIINNNTMINNNNTTNNNNNTTNINNTKNNSNPRDSYALPYNTYQLSSVNPTAHTNVATNNILPGSSYNNSWQNLQTQKQSTSSDNFNNIFNPLSDNTRRQSVEQNNLNSLNSFNYQNWPTPALSSTSKPANIGKLPPLRRDSVSQARQNERFQQLKDSATYNMQNIGYGMPPQPQVLQTESRQIKPKIRPKINESAKPNIPSSQYNFLNLPMNSAQSRLSEPPLYSDQRATPQYQLNRAAEQIRNHEINRNQQQSGSVQPQSSQVPHNSKQPIVIPGPSAPKGVQNDTWPYSNNTFYCDNGLQISTAGSKVTCNNSAEQLNYLNTCFNTMVDPNGKPFNTLNTASNTAVNNRVENTTNSLNPLIRYNEQKSRVTNAFDNYPRPVVPTSTVTENWRTPAVPKQNKQNVNPFTSYNTNIGNPSGAGQKAPTNYQPPPPYLYNNSDFSSRSANANGNQNNYVSAAALSNDIAQVTARTMMSKVSPHVFASSSMLLDRIIEDLDVAILRNAIPQTSTSSQISNPVQSNPNTDTEKENENNASIAVSIECNLIPNNTETDTSNNIEPSAQSSADTVGTNTTADNQISEVPPGVIENKIAEEENIPSSLDVNRYIVETESITPELHQFPDMPSLEVEDFVSTEIFVKLDPNDIIPPEGESEPSGEETESSEKDTEPSEKDTETAEEDNETVTEETEPAEADTNPSVDSVAYPRVMSISPSLMKNENNEEDLNTIEVKPTLKVVNMEEMIDHISEFRLKHFSKRKYKLGDDDDDFGLDHIKPTKIRAIDDCRSCDSSECGDLVIDEDASGDSMPYILTPPIDMDEETLNYENEKIIDLDDELVFKVVEKFEPGEVIEID